MNNRGQSLVTFILILPIILIITSLAIDYGMVSIDKRMISNNMKSSIKYGLKHKNDENIEITIKELIYKNIDKNNIKQMDVVVNNDTILLTIKYKIDGLFDFIHDDMVISYEGKIENNNIRINKR